MAGALGGVMADALGVTSLSMSAAKIAQRIAPPRPASGATTRAKMVVKAVPQTAPRAQNRPVSNLPAV